MATGRVKWFNPEKGFGFIAPDDGAEDLFVHRSGLAVPTAGELAEEDLVSFDAGVSTRGPVAVNVRIIERSGLAPQSQPRNGGYGTPRGNGRPLFSDEELASAPVVRGTIKRFDSEKGFGFISPESGADVFVHQSAAPGVALRPGDQVEFRVVNGERGLRAERVQVVP
jgi:CspA family cold shock protein